MNTLYSHSVTPSTSTPILKETNWRSFQSTDMSAALSESEVTFTRWTLEDDNPTPDVVTHPGHSAQHCIAIALDSTSLVFNHDSKSLWEGPLQKGGAQVTSPNVVTSATFFSRADVLHAYIPRRYIEEAYEDGFGKGYPQSWALDDPRMFHDDQFWRLGMMLLGHQCRYSTVDSPFLTGLGLSMVVRLLSSRFGTARWEDQRVSALPRWKLQRVLDYIETHLADSLLLSDLAQTAGLTRMHFAAQFKAAVGVRPHEYIVRLRIERGRSLLLKANMSIMDVALCCGFKSQAHFTSVFKRFTGATPHQWRSDAGIRISQR